MAETQSAPSLREGEIVTLIAKVWLTEHGVSDEVAADLSDPEEFPHVAAEDWAACAAIAKHIIHRHEATLTEAVAAARAEGVREGLERAAGMEGRFWLELREPRRVPERKGPWPRSDVAKVLREFMAARPQAYITVVSMGSDGPHFDDGPETLQMADARSMSTGRQHIKRVRAAHGSHEDIASLTPGGRTDG